MVNDSTFIDEFNKDMSVSCLPTAFDILTTDYPEPVWIIPKYLPAGMTILAGRPKIGKSWMAFQIALAVASGGMVFEEHISPGKVLYLALEDSHRRLQDRMKEQGWTPEAGKQVTMLTLDEFRKHIGFLHKNGAVKLAALIQAEGYRFVVVDTLARAFVGVKDMNDSQEVTAALSPIQHLSLELNYLTLILDHHGKPKGFSPNPIDDVMSSTAKSAVADTIWGLYHDGNAPSHQLMIVGRDVGTESLAVRWDRITHSWQLVQNEAEKPTDDQTKALVYLKGVKGANLSEIACALNILPSTCSRYVLNPLIVRGQIERNEKKRYYVI